MKWYCEKHTRDFKDGEGKAIHAVQYLYPYKGIKPKRTKLKDVEMIEIENKPGIYSVINIKTGKWIFGTKKWLDTEIRPERNKLLDEVDLKYCNADKWDTMTAPDKAAWRVYKKALKDLPEVIDFDNPVWPKTPGE